MAVFALVSAKGSPGVTTTVAALAAAVVDRGEGAGLLVELDPSGGDAAMLCDRVGEAALVSFAEELRHGTPGADTVWAHTVEAPPGVPAVLGPPGVPEASGVIGSLGDRWLPALRGAAATGVGHPRRLVDAVRGTARCPLAVVVVGARPYPGDEIAAVLDVPLAGVVAWDPRGVTGMWARGER